MNFKLSLLAVATSCWNCLRRVLYTSIKMYIVMFETKRAQKNVRRYVMRLEYSCWSQGISKSGGAMACFEDKKSPECKCPTFEEAC